MSITKTDKSTTISTTEISLVTGSAYSSASPQTNSAIVQVFLDLLLMAAGDKFTFRIYERLNGSTQGVLHEITLVGAQAYPKTAFPALILMDGWDATALKVTGTDRAFPTSVRQVG